MCVDGGNFNEAIGKNQAKKAFKVAFSAFVEVCLWSHDSRQAVAIRSHGLLPQFDFVFREKSGTLPNGNYFPFIFSELV